MVEKNLHEMTKQAAKWSVITELAAKCIAPITSMILARILAPEAFGVLATVTMVIAFAEIFVENGFQKYLIQHIFTSKCEEIQYMSVAFWANLFFSLLLWGGICLFNEPIAELVGNPGKGFLIEITGITIPLYGMIGIQTCNLKKKLHFHKLFYVRIGAALVPLFITIPLALFGMDYWALIIGNILGVAVQSAILFAIGAFKPLFFISWKYLKNMLDYGIWTILNGLATWLGAWIDAFLIGRFLSDYYLGLYRNSTSMIISIFTIVTASIVPVLFSSLSKLQDDDKEFAEMFLSTHRILCMLLLPVGTGVFLFKEFFTEVLLGSQWVEASNIIGITALSIVLRSIYVSVNGDVFRAKGEFKIPLYLQFADLFVVIPACYLSLKRGFWFFVIIASLSKLVIIVPEMLFLCRLISIKMRTIVKYTIVYYIDSIVMLCLGGIWVSHVSFIGSNIIGILLCAIVYGGFLLIIPSERKYWLHYIVTSKIKLQKPHSSSKI